MAIQAPETTLGREEYVTDVLRRFAENPENRDRALAMCLWHLERLALIGSAMETALPGIANNPLLKRMIGAGS